MRHGAWIILVVSSLLLACSSDEDVDEAEIFSGWDTGTWWGDPWGTTTDAGADTTTPDSGDWADAGLDGVDDGLATLPDSGPPSCTDNLPCEQYGLVCNTDEGICVPPLCNPGAAMCLDFVTLTVCADDGLSYLEEPCDTGYMCAQGECRPVICEPGASSCDGGKIVECDDTGTMESVSTCLDNHQCIEGMCRPVLHNIMILFDTSGSMNSCVSGGVDVTEGCNGETIEPWPVCEMYDNPLTKIGYSKKVFHDFFSNPTAQGIARYALLSFPQDDDDSASCTSGYYDAQDEMSGDNDAHLSPAPPSGWFADHLSQVVRVTFPAGWSDSNTGLLLAWVDFEEEQGVNPELRAMGSTPLGKSMFYAGEYFRHYVVVDGKPCTVDADCGSPDYVCIDGVCDDPIDFCRENILIVFTDGNETEHESLEDFFNPVVQARRFKYGLGCASSDGCVGGAWCEGGYCVHPPSTGGACQSHDDCPTDGYCDDGTCVIPGFTWPTGYGECSSTGDSCEPGGFMECIPLIETCQAVDGKYSDGAAGGNRLTTYDGSPLSITTHVINVQGDDDESMMIAEHGGGKHFGVDVADMDLLLEILTEVVDMKQGLSCVPPAE